MLLYRPVGIRELELIAEAKWGQFPVRLATQPIFYPVLSFEYAQAIAREWNTKDAASGYAGFVTAFDVPDEVIARYPVRTAGTSAHRELWVPAEDLAAFNAAIRGPIRVEASFYGEEFKGERNADTGLPTSVEAHGHTTQHRVAPDRRTLRSAAAGEPQPLGRRNEMVSLKREALTLRIGLIMGYTSPSEVVAWADRGIDWRNRSRERARPSVEPTGRRRLLDDGLE